MRGNVTMIGFGEAKPRPDQLIDNDAVLAILTDNGVDVRGKNGADTEALVGIRTRWWSQLSSTELAIEAARAAVADATARVADFDPATIRLVHSGGSSPDNVFPACACEIQGALEIPPGGCEARDISLACSSWVDGLLLAASRMRDKGLRFGLVSNGEAIGTRLNAPTSLSYCLWGDGGGAVVLEHDPTGDPNCGILADRAIVDGQYAGWTRSLKLGTSPDHQDFPHPDASMGAHGKDIHRYAIRTVAAAVAELLDEAGVAGEPVWLVPHNSNLGMVHEIGRRLGIPEERVITRIRDRGNTSSASIPLTLAHAAEAGVFSSGDLLVLAAFGGGMAVNLVLYRWP
jgi:3-oxoacyl-[acyl-carrier-protein] synthase-3